MKNLLSKTMLCGVLASTVILVNCQKAPNKPVKAEVKAPAKVQAVDATRMTLCTKDMVAELKATTEASEKLRDALTKQDKVNSTRLANELNTQSKKAVDMIKAVQVGEEGKKQSALGCEEREGNEAKNKLLKTHTLDGITSVINGLGLAAKKLTGEENDISKGIVTLENKQQLQVVAELAAILSDNANNGTVVSEGKILKGDDAKKALENKNITACALKLTEKSEVKTDAVIEIAVVGDVTESKEKRKTVRVDMFKKVSAEATEEEALAESPAVMALECNLSEGTEKAAAAEARKALGALVKEVVKTAAK